MDGEREVSSGDLAGLLEWWVEAGVDVAVSESPRNWLQPAARGVGPNSEPVANVAEPSHETLA